MKIAVYSGSFNPLHIGHQAIMEYLTRDAAFDWVDLVVSPKNPLKDSISADSGQDRYNAAVEAVKRHPELHVWVDDIELNMDPPHYTIKTLDALKRREPENDFTLIIGADNLDSIHKWSDFPRILMDYGVAVFPRTGSDHEATRKKLMEECALAPSPFAHDTEVIFEDGAMEDEPFSVQEGMRGFENLSDHIYDIRILDAPLVDISSTMIREGLARGEDMSEYLM
ncbi:MAG: nicotinate (nicotinamide) nucleotide adenylyltransferase [Bacteroidales bacterium]|nr:nicotinate (nicotinamide) nucleotide adenylyltransferase [Bacteroidales bacterium]